MAANPGFHKSPENYTTPVRGMARYIQGVDTGEYPPEEQIRPEFLQEEQKRSNDKKARRQRDSDKPF